MPHRRITVLIAALFFLFHTVAALATTTIALVSTDSSAQDSLALLQAQLSSEKSFQFVERSAIIQVLKEQKLTIFADPNHAVILGRLLHADLLAVVESSPDAKAPTLLGLVIYDSATGVRLADLTLTQDKPESLAQTVLTALRAANEKRSTLPDGRKTFCLVAVRNTNLPRDRDSFCDALGLLLQRSLISSPNILLLNLIF